MCRKVICLISFALVLVLAGSASAATVLWDKGGQGNLWSVPANWNPDGLPTAADTAQVFLPGDANKCIIDSSVAAVCSTVSVGTNRVRACYLEMTGGTLTTGGYIRIGELNDSNAVFTMSGGTVINTTNTGRLWVGMNRGSYGVFILNGGEINPSDKVEVGKNAGSNGSLIINGGVLNLAGQGSDDFEIATYGTGTVYMNGGVVNITDQIKLAQGSATATTGIARIYLYGGTINASNLRSVADTYGKDIQMDITDGKLVLRENSTDTMRIDDAAVVNQYIERGWIVAYGGLGIVDVKFDPNTKLTTVTGKRLDPELAWDPTPANLATVQRDVTLSWKPGVYTVSHNLYFGTDFNDVNNATINNPLNVLVKQAYNDTTYNTGPLNFGQTYYWRVDEVNDLKLGSPWKGVVFRFTVSSYIVIDDFESYNDIPSTEPNSHLIYKTWSDGFDNPSVNGSVIGNPSGSTMNTQIFHGGKQSAPVIYNNTVANYSEVTVQIANLGLSRDWAADNFKVLSLWFYGDTTNSATERMYVELNGTRVTYTGPLTDLQQIVWKEWPINLSAFVGIDLSDVTDLSIGFEKADAIGGGRGTVLIDDIRLRLQ